MESRAQLYKRFNESKCTHGAPFVRFVRDGHKDFLMKPVYGRRTGKQRKLTYCPCSSLPEKDFFYGTPSSSKIVDDDALWYERLSKDGALDAARQAVLFAEEQCMIVTNIAKDSADYAAKSSSAMHAVYSAIGVYMATATEAHFAAIHVAATDASNALQAVTEAHSDMGDVMNRFDRAVYDAFRAMQVRVNAGHVSGDVLDYDITRDVVPVAVNAPVEKTVDFVEVIESVLLPMASDVDIATNCMRNLAVMKDTIRVCHESAKQSFEMVESNARDAKVTADSARSTTFRELCERESAAAAGELCSILSSFCSQMLLTPEREYEPCRRLYSASASRQFRICESMDPSWAL